MRSLLGIALACTALALMIGAEPIARAIWWRFSPSWRTDRNFGALVALAYILAVVFASISTLFVRL